MHLFVIWTGANTWGRWRGKKCLRCGRSLLQTFLRKPELWQQREYEGVQDTPCEEAELNPISRLTNR